MTTTIEPDENVAISPGVEQLLREALSRVEAQLIERRELRDQVNAQIKVLVADKETISQALRPFSRAGRNGKE